MDQEIKKVLDGLNALILIHLNNAAHQQYSPDHDPDSMDAKIADGKIKVASLRTIRLAFEDTITLIL
jgi:hypothetical protein